MIAEGFSNEIDWQQQLDFNSITEGDFLREAAWVIFSSGMRESVVRTKFAEISNAFLDWESGSKIASYADQCRQSALSIFGHEGKVEAVLTLAREVSCLGFVRMRRKIEEKGIAYLQAFPFLGPATSYHLAKNLGFDTAKPDRHLQRIAYHIGYSSPIAMCRNIAEIVGDKVSVVDLVLWRYATLDREYLKVFDF